MRNKLMSKLNSILIKNFTVSVYFIIKSLIEMFKIQNFDFSKPYLNHIKNIVTA